MTTTWKRIRPFTAIFWGILFCLLTAPHVAGQEAPLNENPKPEKELKEASSELKAVRLRLPLPITDSVDNQFKQSLRSLLATKKPGQDRLIVVVEMEGTKDEATQSEFERSLSLARFLTSKEVAPLKVIAYLKGSIQGHAVLVALGCEQIIMHPDSDLGSAGIHEEKISLTMRGAYQEIAGLRNVLPSEMALGMLDPALEVYQVNKNRFVTGEAYSELKDKGQVAVSEKLVGPGQMLQFSATDLRQKYQLISNVAEDYGQLAQQLEVPFRQIAQETQLDRKWVGIRLSLDGEISNRLVQRTSLSIRSAVDDQTNLVVLDINSTGGNPIACENMVNFLIGLSQDVHTVALVTEKANANAALIAMACDEIAVAPGATLGGEGSYEYSDQGKKDLQSYLEQVSPETGRSWSVWAAMNNPRLSVFVYTDPDTGFSKLLSEEEAERLNLAGKWNRGNAITQPDQTLALDGKQALDFGVAESMAENVDNVAQRFGIENDLEAPKRSWADELIEVLASPRLAFFCLFLGVIALIGEMKAPGVGVPGFVASLCLGLFFWSRFLNGTAGWLEALLLIGGIFFILLEVFVLPGVGIFGLGGAFMMILGIVLAMQTFIWPTTDYELDQVPYSLGSILFLFFSVLCAAVFAHYLLPKIPYVNQLMLENPDEESLDELRRRETIVDLSHLIGQTGYTLTPLRPTGKAKFGQEIVNVSSDGEFIERDQKVLVELVRGNYAVIRTVS